MNYWRFRLRVYRSALYQLLDSIKQISFGLVALFPLAMPALVLIPLLALNVLADPNADNPLYFSTLWGYLLFAYSWVAMQRDGITAHHYRLYDLSLPITQRTRQLTELGITLYAANLLVLGPFLLLCFMLTQHTEEIFSQPLSVTSIQLMPIFGLTLLTGYYCLRAVQQKLPWLSLLVMPVIGLYFADVVAKFYWLGIWLAAIVIERYTPINRLSLGDFPNGIWRFYLQADVSQAKQNLIRYVAIILLLIIADICTQSVKPTVQPYVGNFFSFVFGILLATKLLDILRLRKTYQFYLAYTPASHILQLCYGLIYCLLYTSLALLLLVLFAVFDSQQWIFLAIFYLSAQMGILTLSKYYLVLPICSPIILWLIL
ncbi:MAG: DUF6136 family protein [Paraglaciecola sp.]|uniref:DUF6136 family protein n=1 Tax=Paraglaciecola sp. TaxID=1920173 RepID=UPI003298D765